MRKIRQFNSWLIIAFILHNTLPFSNSAADDTVGFTIEKQGLRLIIKHESQPVGEYVIFDKKIPRPYFANLHAPGGIRVTRNHPPIAGQDSTDHDLLHPGLWLAFGDLNGVDFWRNKGRVEHLRFVVEPRTELGRLMFAVEESYRSPEHSEVCRGVNEFCFVAGSSLTTVLPGTLVMWRTTLRNGEGTMVFGPQHEMGLGFRMSTELAVKGASGSIQSSHGGLNEPGNWGLIGSWWNYSGITNDHHAGILACASTENSRPVWSHARDYGFLAMNPTGPPPGAKDVPSIPFTIQANESLHMKFGLLLHASKEPIDPSRVAIVVNDELDSWK